MASDEKKHDTLKWTLGCSPGIKPLKMGQKWAKNGVNNYGDFWAKYGIKLIK